MPTNWNNKITMILKKIQQVSRFSTPAVSIRKQNNLRAERPVFFSNTNFSWRKNKFKKC